LEKEIKGGAFMSSDLVNTWFKFIRDIDISPPQFPNTLSIEAWSPVDTKDTIRLKQKRPLLRKLLTSLEQGTYDERHYPLEWRQRRSFQLLTANQSTSNSLQDWILNHMTEYDEDFLWNLQSNLRQEIEAQFIRISTHELELYTSSVALFDKINLLQRELGTKRKRNLANKTSKTQERASLFELYESKIIKPQKDILSQIEGTRVALYEYMKNLILDIDSNSLIGFKELSQFPSLDGILDILETLPDLSDPESLRSLDYKQIETNVNLQMELYVQKLSESLEIEPNSIELDYTIGSKLAKPMNIQVNINTSGKQTNVMQNTTLHGDPDKKQDT
jgi:hypothetical protein